MAFYEFKAVDTLPDLSRILEQVKEAGFVDNPKIYFLGHDTEDSMSLIVEGKYQGEQCCVAVGYGMNRQQLAIRKKWYRHAPQTAT